MPKDPIHIKFQNRYNPQAGFDWVALEEVATRKNLNHSPYQLHLVEFFIIIIIYEGEGKHTIDFQDYEYKKGTLFTIRKDQIHRFHKSVSGKGVMLLFTDNFLVTYLEKLEALKTLQLFNEVIGVPKVQLPENETEAIFSQVERMKKEYFEQNDDYSLGIIRSELHILIAKLYRIKAQQDQMIRNRKYLNEFITFQNLVEKNAAEHKQVKAYAKMMGLSSKTLNTITRAIVHKSAKAFVDEICIKQIKRLLINTDLSVKEIAYASGFEESTNFYKYFKRQTQVTPEKFRGSKP